MQYSRKMCLDYGKARIGVAFSDLTQTIATADHIYKTQTEQKDIEYFAKLIAEKSVDEVVFGLPLQTDGSEGELCEIVRNFAGKLQERTGVKLAFQDERYTSYEAEELLKEAKINWQKRKEFLDKVSAQIILQDYLDKK